MTNSPVLAPNAWLRFDVIQRELARIGDIQSVAEIGCGKGAFSAWLATQFQMYTGYESDGRSYQVARERLESKPGARIFNTRLPKPTDSVVDLFVACEVLEHIEDDAAAIQSWQEWLRPGGYLLLSVPAHPSRFGAWDLAVGHYRRYCKESLLELIRAAGLRPLAVKMYGGPLGYILEWVRNALARRLEPDAPLTERTAASGRLHQPPANMGLLLRIATFPFRLMQRPFENSNFGTGLIVLAKKG